MAGLKETEKWENEIYRIEENDPVHGGEDGITNKPLKQLANRTKYLKTEVEKRYIAQDASTTQKGLVQLDSSTDSNAEDKAATPKAVNTVKLLVNAVRSALSNYIPNSKKSNADNSSSSDTIATSYALKKVRDIATKRATDTTAGQTVLSHKINGTDKTKAASEFALGELHKKSSNKADIKHNHIASDITDFNQATQSVVHNLFNQLHSETGWQKLPSGLILQWGHINCNVDTVQTISFPISFSRSCFGMTIGQTALNGQNQSIGGYGGRIGELSYGNVTRTNFKIANDGAAARAFWIAIGY